jgi:hypothetical protein
MSAWQPYAMNEATGFGTNAAHSAMMGRMPRLVAVEELFKGRHFDREIVVLCLRWYLSFKLSQTPPAKRVA